MAKTKIGQGMDSEESYSGKFTLVEERWREGDSWIEDENGDYLDLRDLLSVISEFEGRLDGKS